MELGRSLFFPSFSGLARFVKTACRQSDFGLQYFAHHRTNPDYRPTDPERFRHTDELLKLFSVLMDDPRFEMTLKSEKGLDIMGRYENNGNSP